ncbi:hypothetical protein QJS10_CPA10g01985 [Acorus calamus]|uniref:Uncharacterized protein n=1 Tax=Acorus calamus TaxID=4465 RepID=A0AAV9DX24_ACOCL|nr:hypothetical protein QJS10_CPA10g01985 [Acorus calamus]
MALETVNPPPAPPTTHTAQLVGQVFVEQYYQILHNSPEHLFKFYQDSSVFCRPGPDGSMISIRTMQGINDKVLSLDSKHITAEIENVDSHDSFMGGVTVFVTGYLTGKDDVRKEFVQSFFLAPQEKGYFVQNDIFRYVGGCPLVGANNHLPTNGSSEDTQLEPSQGVDHQVVESATPPPLDEVDEGPEVCEPLENGTGAHSPVVQVIQEDPAPAPVVRSIPSSVKEDAQKKTYASIVKVMKDNKSPPPIVKAAPVHVPTTAVKASSPVKNTLQQVVAATTPVPPPETSAPDSTNVSETCNTPEVEGHSVYVRNLPLNITASQLELEFKKFGAIRPGGVQVRSNKQEPPYCFGFVEFESLSSMQTAIEASPVMVGDRKVQVEVKRTTSRVGGYGPRSRFIQAGRTGGGYRNDSFRGGRRGGYGAGGGGGRGYSRGEYGNHRGEFSGRPRANYQNMGSFGNSNRAVRAVESNRVATVSA